MNTNYKTRFLSFERFQSVLKGKCINLSHLSQYMTKCHTKDGILVGYFLEVTRGEESGLGGTYLKEVTKIEESEVLFFQPSNKPPIEIG